MKASLNSKGPAQRAGFKNLGPNEESADINIKRIRGGTVQEGAMPDTRETTENRRDCLATLAPSSRNPGLVPLPPPHRGSIPRVPPSEIKTANANSGEDSMTPTLLERTVRRAAKTQRAERVLVVQGIQGNAESAGEGQRPGFQER